MKKVICLILVMLLVMGCTACGNSNADTGDKAGNDDKAAVTPRELRFSTPAQEGTSIYDAMVECKEYIEEHTNGELTVTIYTSDTLGNWTQVYDELMMGSIDMALSNAPDTYQPVLGIPNLPYICADYDEAREVFALDSYLTEVAREAHAKSGVKFFGFSVNGFDGVGTNKEITDPTSVTGKKNVMIRVPTGIDTTKVAMEHLGFMTSSLPFSDIYSSIQTGVIEGYIGTPPHGHYLMFRDVETHLYLYNSLLECSHLMFSAKVWDELTPEQQEVVQTAMEQCALRSVDDAISDSDKYLELLRNEPGFTVVEFTADELRAFANECYENVWPQFYEDYGEDIMKGLLASK